MYTDFPPGRWRTNNELLDPDQCQWTRPADEEGVRREKGTKLSKTNCLRGVGCYVLEQKNKDTVVYEM